MATENAKEKWRARFLRNDLAVKNANPFGLRFSDALPNNADAVAEFPAGLSSSTVEKIARDVAPAGYVFSAVEKVEEF